MGSGHPCARSSWPLPFGLRQPHALRAQGPSAAEKHLRALKRGEQVVVLDAVDEQLAHEPAVETRNRKPMRPNPLAPWELRIGRLRVYYDVKADPDAVVEVRAVGGKERDCVRIGGKAVRL